MKPVAVVTGGKQGIGRGISLALAREGFDIVILDLVQDEAALSTQEEIRQHGAQVVFIACDISDVEALPRVAGEAIAAFGSVHTLVNNAGVQSKPEDYGMGILDITPAVFDRVMNINLRGTLFVSQVFARHMKNTHSDFYRSIITISSINAKQVRVDAPEYTISKSGLSTLNQILASRLANNGIGCFEVLPGLIETDMTKGNQVAINALLEQGLIPMPRWGQPEDVGQTVATLASGTLAYSTGEAIHVDGGMHIQRPGLVRPKR